MMARTITMQNLVEIARRTSERGCTVNWATNQLGDRRLGDIPTGRQPTGRQRLDDWATSFGQLGDKAITVFLELTTERDYIYK